MELQIENFLNRIEKISTTPLEAVQNGLVASIEAIQKGLTTSINAIEKSLTVSVDTIQKSTAVSIDAIKKISNIQGHPLAIVNGVIGDMLEDQKHKLSIPMELLGRPTGKKICILVHGLCASEKTWKYRDGLSDDYGLKLAQELGYSSFYLRYNSGLHISTNGQRLSKILDDLCRGGEHDIDEIIFIGHSMGGLVVRSACHYGQKHQTSWINHVRKIFLLGVPNHGSEWEKLGNLTSTVLGLIPNLVTNGIALVGNRRSAGIKDLRFGYLIDEDWKDCDENALLRDNRCTVPLLKGVDYHLVAATMAKKSDNIFTQYFGDGLVPIRSAHGQSFIKSKRVPYLRKHSKIIRGLSHTGLAHDDRVYKYIRRCCSKSV